MNATAIAKVGRLLDAVWSVLKDGKLVGNMVFQECCITWQWYVCNG